jgi:DNA repair ATPase RecN
VVKIPKKDILEEISPKDFQNLIEQTKKLNDAIESLKSMPKKVKKLEERFDKVQDKIDSVKKNSETIQKLTDQMTKLETSIKSAKEEISAMKKDISFNQERMEQTIRTQEEIIMDMINKFNEQLLIHKSQMQKDVESIKTQQDVLRISYTVNEKKLMDKINISITKSLRKLIQGKESELLMKIWVDEFREIIENFENLKKLKPKEFSIRLTEIADTIEIFKQKIKG